MIRIKRITDLERFAETVPKPKGAVPGFGLPKWKIMPLEHKIPMIPGPNSAYSFTRHKVGKKLWGQKLEFDLSDPYCHETKFPYEPLHDEHLVEFFSRPINLKCLLKADLITDNMDVKCSLRDYNGYRRYLRQVHTDRVKKELRRRDHLFVERTALRFAEDQARKEVERLKEREKVANERQRLMQQRSLQEELRIRKLKERACRTTQRLKLLRLIRQEERRLINIKSEKRVEYIRQKCKLAAEIARRKVIDTLVDWEKKDETRKKAKEKRLLDIERLKQKELEERWRKRQQFQERDIAKQKVLLQRIDTRRQKFIEDYNKKINEETAKMKRLLDDTKLFTNCYMKRHLPDGRKLICCKKYFKSDLDRKKNEVSSSQNSANLLSKFKKRKKQSTNGKNIRSNVTHKQITSYNNKIKRYTDRSVVSRK